MEADRTNESLEHRLGRRGLPESQYRADLELHDRSLQFSAELVRLSLAGIAVVGFLISHLPEDQRRVLFGNTLIKFLASGSLVALGISTGFALWYRFVAGGAAFHHFQAIKLLLIGDAGDRSQIDRELELRAHLFRRSHWFLMLASICILLGAGLLGVTFILLLFL